MPTVTRHGIVKNVTLTYEASALLEALAPSSKSQGHYLSQLIIVEATRMAEREKLRRVLSQVLAEEPT